MKRHSPLLVSFPATNCLQDVASVLWCLSHQQPKVANSCQSSSAAEFFVLHPTAEPDDRKNLSSQPLWAYSFVGETTDATRKSTRLTVRRDM